jgi:hypothetical protein
LLTNDLPASVSFYIKEAGDMIEDALLSLTIQRLQVIKNDTDYEITHARIKYSHNFEVDCSRISDEDWHDGPEFIFKNNVANVNMPGEYDEKTKLHRAPMCYQYVSLWGGAEETIIATIWFAATVRMTQAKFAGPVQL